MRRPYRGHGCCTRATHCIAPTKPGESKGRNANLNCRLLSQPGAYFVTLCTHRRICIFGAMVGEETRLNETGRIVTDCRQAIPRHFPAVTLDEWAIMPNHLHGIVMMLGETTAHSSAPRPPLGTVLRAFNSRAAKRVKDGAG